MIATMLAYSNTLYYFSSPCLLLLFWLIIDLILCLVTSVDYFVSKYSENIPLCFSVLGLLFMNTLHCSDERTIWFLKKCSESLLFMEWNDCSVNKLINVRKSFLNELILCELHSSFLAFKTTTLSSFSKRKNMTDEKFVLNY